MIPLVAPIVAALVSAIAIGAASASALAEEAQVWDQVRCNYLGGPPVPPVPGFSVKPCDFELHISGPISAAMVGAVQAGLAHMDVQFARSGLLGLVIHLNSSGGDVEAAMTIGRLLRKHSSPVTVDGTETCVSACVFILAGAITREIYGRVGIHRPYLETSNKAPTEAVVKEKIDQTQEIIRAYFKEMNISERLSNDMMTIPSDQVRYLTTDDLVNYGIGPIDPVKKETWELEAAQRLGLDRLEYMRRRDRQHRECDGTGMDSKQSSECYDRIMHDK